MTIPRAFGAVFGMFLVFTLTPAMGQSGPPKAGTPNATTPAETPKDGKKQEEYAEALKVLGAPAGNPECVWTGRRAVSLLWRDDLDTAFRHIELYERFGCPTRQIQLAFRCVIRQGDIDPKSPDSLNARVHACWLHPDLPPSPPPAAAAPAGTPATPKR